MPKSGAAALRTLRLYRYDKPSLRFAPDGGREEPLGAVLTGAPAATPDRLDDVFRTLGPETDADTFLERLGDLAEAYGRALRGFAEAGCFRYSGTVDNWGLGGSDCPVYLVDLDSSRRLT